MTIGEKHPHYHKGVRHLATIDVYRVLERFNVTHPSVQHAVKKLLVAGQRGSKDFDKDIQEAIDSLRRCQEMREEDAREFTSVVDNETFDPRPTSVEVPVQMPPKRVKKMPKATATALTARRKAARRAR